MLGAPRNTTHEIVALARMAAGGGVPKHTGMDVYGLPYFQKPVTLLAVAGSYALALSSMGLLIGSVARTDKTAVILVIVPMFVFSALGGAWLPVGCKNLIRPTKHPQAVLGPGTTITASPC